MPDPKEIEGASHDDTATVEVIAAAIHETWRALAAAEGWRMSPRFDHDYALLEEVDREDNRAAARRMPEVLALAGLTLSALPGLPENEVAAQLARNIERLAEAEHDGWMMQRAQHGWRFAETRDDAAKLHPAMRPYSELSEQEKGKDRNSVRNYPRFAERAGLGIAWLE